MAATNTQLKGVNEAGDSLMSDQLEANLTMYFQWGLLGVGAFFNVTIPTSGCYGGDQSRLRLVDDPNYQQGQVWEAFRKDWVWETGVGYYIQPIRVSGVYVNGAFHAVTETGAYAHHADYLNGRIVFDNPIAASTVACEYSYRLFQFYTADCPWWQQVQPNSFRVDDYQFLQTGSGAWDTLAQNRVQLPAVIVEAVPNTTRTPKALGSIGAIVRQEVLFHIVSEERWNYKWMHDVITAQWEMRLDSFDKNLMFDADAFPVQPDGSPKPSGMMYPDLIQPTGVGGFKWEQIRLVHMRSQDQPRLGNLHFCTVRATCEVDQA